MTESLPPKKAELADWDIDQGFDDGGLSAPPHLHGWRKAWWWFDFIILVKLARLRFIGVLVIIGAIITQWDTIAAYYDKWTRPANEVAAAASNIEYFCPMHPSIIRDNPKDKCPICFMPLSKRKKGAAVAEALPPGVVNRVQLSPYRVVLAGVATWPVNYLPLSKEITAVGYVEFNERGQRTVSARVNGRIDRLFVSETGQFVKAGDPLASLYSPDLFVTVRNLREAQVVNNQANVASARARLKLQGIDDVQIDEVLDADVAETHLSIRSPISGHVINKYVREGQYVDEGMPLYDLADLSTVWIQAQVYEDDLAFFTASTPNGAPPEPVSVAATTRAFPDRPFTGKLAFVYPHADQDTRTVTVRFEVENPDHQLRPGSTANVTLTVPLRSVAGIRESSAGGEAADRLAQGEVLATPESSVIDTGTQRIVYRQSSPGVFEGVTVKLGSLMTGPDGAGYFPVLEGLKSGERVVTSGSFLVDAETRLNPAAGSIYFGGSSGSKEDSSSVTITRPSTPDDPEALIEAALTSLSPEDRQLVDAQRYCPVLIDSKLGGMGPPVKLIILGEPVFLCCSGCKSKALKDSEATVAKVKELRETNLKTQPTTGRSFSTSRDPEAGGDPEIDSALAELSARDRQLAKKQRFCAVINTSRLGSMGPPVKLILHGRPVFLCCDGCKSQALKDPPKTLAQVDQLLRAHPGSPEP